MTTDRSVSPMAPALRIERLPYADPVVQELVEEVQQEYVVRYGGPDGALMEDPMFDPPSGAFFVAFLDEEPVAPGAWRVRDGVDALRGGRGGGIKRGCLRARGRRAGVP